MAEIHREQERREKLAEKGRAKFNRSTKDIADPRRSASLHESPTLKNIEGAPAVMARHEAEAAGGDNYKDTNISAQSVRPTIAGAGIFQRNHRTDITGSSGLVSNPMTQPRLDLSTAQV